MDLFHPKDSFQFSCVKDCIKCCSGEPGFVYLSEKDLTKLLSHFKMKARDFVQKYCRFTSYYDENEVLCLQEKYNYECIFLEKCGCSVYEARPIQCSTYPFWTTIVYNKKSWDREAEDCPGMNQGAFISKETAMKQNFLYEENTPITRALGRSWLSTNSTDSRDGASKNRCGCTTHEPPGFREL
jgi:Fe-S-cluster containining protein